MALILTNPCKKFQAYGITLACDLPLDHWLRRSNQPADLTVTSHQGTENLPTPDVHPIFTHPKKDKFGSPISQMYRLGNVLYFRIPPVGAFFLAQDKIHIEIQPKTDPTIVCATLISSVLSLWLELRKIRCIHASCLIFKNKSAVFMGDSTTGKSTLSAALLKAGAGLLSDDIVPIIETPEGFLAYPSYPSLRLSLEQAKHFLGKQVRIARWYPALGKAVIPIGANGWGRFFEAPQKIHHLYLLKRCPNRFEGIVQFEDLSKTDSALKLIRQSFIRRSPLALGIAAERLAFFTRLVEQIHVTRLTYPTGYEHLPQISELILQNMQTPTSH